jgi:hypothetical protein
MSQSQPASLFFYSLADISFLPISGINRIRDHDNTDKDAKLRAPLGKVVQNQARLQTLKLELFTLRWSLI